MHPDPSRRVARTLLLAMTLVARQARDGETGSTAGGLQMLAMTKAGPYRFLSQNERQLSLFSVHLGWN